MVQNGHINSSESLFLQLFFQISFGATSDKFSDSLVYPSFFRTVPSDIRQVDAMAQLINKFGWNWVAVVGSEEEYGQQGVQQFSKKAENMSVCVAYQGLIPIYDDPKPAIETIISNIKTTEVKVVVVFALVGPAVSFFEEVRKPQTKNQICFEVCVRVNSCPVVSVSGYQE